MKVINHSRKIWYNRLRQKHWELNCNLFLVPSCSLIILYYTYQGYHFFVKSCSIHQAFPHPHGTVSYFEIKRYFVQIEPIAMYDTLIYKIYHVILIMYNSHLCNRQTDRQTDIQTDWLTTSFTGHSHTLAKQTPVRQKNYFGSRDYI